MRAPAVGHQRHEAVAQFARRPAGGSRPAASRTSRTDRRTLPASSGVPTLDANTSPCSCHRFPAGRGSWSAARRCGACSASTARRGRANVRRDLRVFVSPSITDRPPDLHRRRDRRLRVWSAVKVDMFPFECPQFLGARAGEQGHHDVGVEVRCLRRRRAAPSPGRTSATSTAGLPVRSGRRRAATTLRRTRSRAIARLTTRFKGSNEAAARCSCSSVADLAASHRSTSVALSSRSLRAPRSGMMWPRHRYRYFVTVVSAAGRPKSYSQSLTGVGDRERYGRSSGRAVLAVAEYLFKLARAPPSLSCRSA